MQIFGTPQQWLWEQTSRIDHKAFPQDFESGRDRLEWGWFENRPFLRCLHGLALVRYDDGEIGEALKQVKHRLPKTAIPDTVTIGGTDEAYYWEQWGQFREENTEALGWLRKTMR
ncbi:hypothetical protein ACFLVC_00985 [Chloroflexota bacterium]